MFLQTQTPNLSITWMSRDEADSLSNGEVLNPETFNYQTFTPVPGGLYCEEVFGPATHRGRGALGALEPFGHVALPFEFVTGSNDSSVN